MPDIPDNVTPVPAKPTPGQLRRILWRALLAALLLPVVLVVGCEVMVLHNKSVSEKANRANGDRILQSLQVYYKDHKRYPDGLETLVPAYTAALPKYGMTTSRQDIDFNYKPSSNGQQFELSFMGSPVTVGPCDCRYRYSSATGKWEDVAE